MLNDVIINKGQNGLGSPLPGTDYVSGLLFYSDATLPAGFSSTDRIKIVNSVSDAVNLGITNGSLGETRATATFLFTTKFASGDTFKLTCATIDSTNPLTAISNNGTVTLCNFTAVTADAASTTTSAARVASEINAGTLTHGFSAVASTATVTITAPAGQGIFLNTGTPYVNTITGTGAGTLTQNVTPGVASDIDILYYHISEFFRLQPQGKLYIGIYATSDVGTWNSITLMQNFAQGGINQIGIYQKSAAFATSQANGIQGVCSALEVIHKPLIAILAGEISATADVSQITTNLHALSDPNVSVTIGQDGAAQGFKLFKATGKSITNLGEVLGAVALAKVNESIAWFGKFQVSSTELDTLAFANGQLYTSLSDGTIVNLDTLGFMFLRKVIDLNGSFHNRPYTAISLSNDYTFIYRNRTIYKAIKGMRSTVLPAVASPVKANPDGTLSLDTIGYFESLANQGLANMLGPNQELSAAQIIIDATQNVVSTGQLYITAKLLPYGTADFIIINVGFTTSISQ